MVIFLAPLFGSGPIWHDIVDNVIETCYKNWWTNLLFINNFYHADDICLPQTWYISSDFQLYVAALIILLPMIKWPKVGIALGVVGVIASMTYSGAITYINNYPPAMLFSHPDLDDRKNFWSKFFFNPFVHAGPYCIGLLAGYLLATKPNLKIPKLALIFGWSLAIISNTSVLYGVLEWNKGADPTLLETLLYSSCNRVAWAMGVAWMIVCCTHGYGGVVNYILTWQCWILLGRLSFLAYLLHPFVQIAVIGNFRTQMQPSHFVGVWLFFGHLCATYGSAFACNMLIEAPFVSLEKIFFPTLGRQVKNINGNNLKNGINDNKSKDITVIVRETINDGDGLKKSEKS